jgi:membrane-bound metal-dependent hydrolase YbcI (DUF457 family)
MMGRTHMAFGMLFTATGLPVASHLLGLDFSTTEVVVGVAIGSVAGVLPDIDHPDSLLTHGIIPGTRYFGPIGKALGWFLSLPPRLMGLGVRQVVNHRGGTHSLLFGLGWALLAAPIYVLLFAAAAFVLGAILGPLVALIGISGTSVSGALGTASHIARNGILGHLVLISFSVFLGYFAHLFSDSLTKVPVPWPWPFKIGPNEGRWFLAPAGFRVKTGSTFETHVIKPLVYLAAFGALLALTVLPAGQNWWQHRGQNVDHIKGQIQKP